MTGSELNDKAYESMVIIVGSAMIDLTAYCTRLPKYGETIRGNEFQRNFGGKGANQAVQCSRLGIQTAFIGTLGCDSYGKDYLLALEKEGINTSEVLISTDYSTGIASIWVDASGGNSIVIIPGANLSMSPDIAVSKFPFFPLAKVALFQNEILPETNRAAMKEARSRGICTIFNPAPADLVDCLELLEYSDIICLNEVELELMSSISASTADFVSKACASLMSRNNRIKAVIATLGSMGAYLLYRVSHDNSPNFEHILASNVNVIDTVGAGDAFIGCLAANYTGVETLSSAVRKAVECASFSVQYKGAQSSYGYFKDFSK